MKTSIKIIFSVLLIIGLVSFTLAVTPPQAFGFDRILNLSDGYAYFDKILIGDPTTPLDLNSSFEVQGNSILSGVLNVSGQTNFATDVVIAGQLRGNSPLEIVDSININGTIMHNGKDISEIYTTKQENVTIESRINSTADESYIEFQENGGILIGI